MPIRYFCIFIFDTIAHSFDVVTTTNMGSGWVLGLFSKLVQAGSLTFLNATNWGYLLHVEHMSCVLTNCGRHQ